MLPTLSRVGIIEDEPQMRELLAMQLRSIGLAVDCFASAEEFLENSSSKSPQPDCILLDVQLSGMDGLAVQGRLAAESVRLPIIFITGYAETSMVVRAVKMGAFDFLEKPVARDLLLSKVLAAIVQGANIRHIHARHAAVSALIGLLSPREHEVFNLLLAARTTKQISVAMKISDKTVAKHREKVLQKLRVDSVVELVRVAGQVEA